MISEREPAYEAARWWAWQPVGRPPPGWAQVVRTGIATWVREEHRPTVPPALTSQPVHLSVSPLLTIVAAMIAEVCQ
ncbi:MAG TPA: hypothetical protein VF043_31335 [Ktedonobacteraceae bacterium]